MWLFFCVWQLKIISCSGLSPLGRQKAVCMEKTNNRITMTDLVLPSTDYSSTCSKIVQMSQTMVTCSKIEFPLYCAVNSYWTFPTWITNEYTWLGKRGHFVPIESISGNTIFQQCDKKWNIVHRCHTQIYMGQTIETLTKHEILGKMMTWWFQPDFVSFCWPSCRILIGLSIRVPVCVRSSYGVTNPVTVFLFAFVLLSLCGRSSSSYGVNALVRDISNTAIQCDALIYIEIQIPMPKFWILCIVLQCIAA